MKVHQLIEILNNVPQNLEIKTCKTETSRVGDIYDESDIYGVYIDINSEDKSVLILHTEGPFLNKKQIIKVLYEMRGVTK